MPGLPPSQRAPLVSSGFGSLGESFPYPEKQTGHQEKGDGPARSPASEPPAWTLCLHQKPPTHSPRVAWAPRLGEEGHSDGVTQGNLFLRLGERGGRGSWAGGRLAEEDASAPPFQKHDWPTAGRSRGKTSTGAHSRGPWFLSSGRELSPGRRPGGQNPVSSSAASIKDALF